MHIILVSKCVQKNKKMFKQMNVKTKVKKKSKFVNVSTYIQIRYESNSYQNVLYLGIHFFAFSD